MAFIAGLAFLGILSAGAGFVDNKIAIIIFRALMGIAAVMTIPSALILLVLVFPEPLEQARAIGVFGGRGAIGNVLALFNGAVLVEYASYHWVFWFVAIVSIPMALCCTFIIPLGDELHRTAVHNVLPEMDYWPYIFPALTFGSASTMLVYSHTNIAIFQPAPASMAGTVGAIFNGALQFGSAIGLAAFTSKTSVETKQGGPQEYYGHAAAFLFLLGIVLFENFSVLCFYRTGTGQESQSGLDDTPRESRRRSRMRVDRSRMTR